jgi:hypothetical protein
MHRWPDYALEYFVDDQSGRAFMLAADRGGGDRDDHRPISVVVNLSRATSRDRQVMGSPADIVRLRKYVFHTNDVLLLGELP